MKPHKFPQTILAILVVISLIGYPFLPQKAAASVDGAPASSAHYIVFETHSGGTAEPVFYKQVTLAAPLQSLSAAQLDTALAQPSRNTNPILVTLRSPEGMVVYRDVVGISPWLRGEFHGETPDAPIDGHIFPQDSPAFVVRVPVIKGATLSLENASRQPMGSFDLAQLVRETPEIDLSRSQEITDKSALSGSPANRVDFLIMGDGYTSGQAGDFATDAAAVATEFFSISPYAEYLNYVNVHTLFTASVQSGSDHPPYVAGCTSGSPTCCGDSAAASDPLQGTYANTAFDSTFCYYNIHRLLVSSYSKVIAAAAAVPGWDQILVLVNDTVYGGSGGAFATVSMHSSAAEIAQHEYGHSFADLADEYESPYPGFPACSDASGSGSPCESNVTNITNRPDIKWFPWILPTTPIPTPNNGTYNGLVGLFEGARYLSSGMYRPGYSCIMRSLGAPYCQVPSQSYVLKLYNGGWGTPFGGLSLIEPGTLSPNTSTVDLSHPATQVFHADILSPVGGPPVQITWLVDGFPVPAASGDTFTYTTSAPGTIQVALRVNDTTSLVNPIMGGNALEDYYAWDVNVTVDQHVDLAAAPATLVADGVSASTITATVTTGVTPQAGETVTFTTSLGSLNPLVGVTNASGVVTTTLTSTTTLGIATITASTDLVADATTVAFIAGPPASVLVNATPDILPANGVSLSHVAALVTDNFGNPVSGVTVTFTATLGIIQPITATTDISGLATTVFTVGTITGTATITATMQTDSDTATVSLVNMPYKLYMPLIRKP